MCVGGAIPARLAALLEATKALRVPFALGARPLAWLRSSVNQDRRDAVGADHGPMQRGVALLVLGAERRARREEEPRRLELIELARTHQGGETVGARFGIDDASGLDEGLRRRACATRSRHVQRGVAAAAAWRARALTRRFSLCRRLGWRRSCRTLLTWRLQLQALAVLDKRDPLVAVLTHDTAVAVASIMTMRRGVEILLLNRALAAVARDAAPPVVAGRCAFLQLDRACRHRLNPPVEGGLRRRHGRRCRRRRLQLIACLRGERLELCARLRDSVLELVDARRLL